MKNFLIIFIVLFLVFLFILAIPILFIKALLILKYFFHLTFPVYVHVLQHFGLSNEFIRFIGLPIFIFAVFVFFISLFHCTFELWKDYKARRIDQIDSEDDGNPL
ncbi:hypothetical protein [Acinetobacter sp. ANC 4641]|uniref:hypothetical protein n=1 Tax=Acinetobacter sp. ANC 4641 TaxID=2529847 RepID=UPI00103B5C5F|nr:hypothetical protein [Acinetobacter sp. ANC 4641]TCB05667.1 hypothetical protein E0H78_13795 [Acinetobacter sp. ANC 4641]